MTERKSAAWSTADAIKQHIIDAGLAPGELMPTESDLCDTLHVSRSSVREAMRTLASLDIVEVRHGHGTYVGRMSLDPLVNGMVFRLSATGVKSLRDVVQTRIALDLAMADELVKAYSGTHDPVLHELVDQMRVNTDAGRSFMEQDRDFHARLAAGIDNQIIGELAGAFWEIHTRALPLLGVSTPQDIIDTVEAHAAIIEAVETGDLRAYQSAVAAHYAPLQRAIERSEAAEAR
ncbi:MAG TPA: GntR family transcriptional regulator [Dermatophilaceae bacterium]|nr:GntR family transcriptional regulator [Dermatophilaceae bacterium]